MIDIFTFRKKIKCLNCGKNFKTKTQSKKSLYVCSGFANYGQAFCNYYPIYEDDLIYIVKKHLQLNGKSDNINMSDYVSSIEVKGVGYRIIYNDKSDDSLINWELDKYGVKVRY